jgi:hypothetical protein
MDDASWNGIGVFPGWARRTWSWATPLLWGAFALVAAVTTPGGLGQELLPDLSVWVSPENQYLYGWYLDRNEPSQPGRTLLRVSVATPNSGQGPLELRGSSSSPDIYQRIYHLDGSWEDAYAGTFTFHPTHSHIHFDDWVRLQLRSVTPEGEPGEPVGSGTKTSFSIVDVQAYDLSLPGAAPFAQYEGGLVQGISVGWSDVYNASLPDQWIDVTDVPSGHYYLEAVVDPDEHVREVNEGNNVARILIELVQPSDGDGRPANDDFIAATVLDGVAAGDVVDTSRATVEPGEPNHVPNGTGGASVWWRWAAPFAQTVVLSTEGSSFDTVLAVYTGTSVARVSELTLLAADDDGGASHTSRLTFNAAANRTYYIAVDGFDAATGVAQLQINPAWNDAFGNCQALTGGEGMASGSTVGATAEPGEPQHGGTAEFASLWYCWTALRTGEVVVDTSASAANTAVAVYTGNALDTLTRIDSAGAGESSARVTFSAAQGTSYHIAVAVPSAEPGVIRLHWVGPGPPRIVSSPASTNVMAGSPAAFHVSVSGVGPFGFQWRHAGTNLLENGAVSGVSTDTLRIEKAHLSDMGGYAVVISNVYGAITSPPASLIVIDNPRVVYVPELEGTIGAGLSVPVLFRGLGDESAIQFSVLFEPQLLPQVQVTDVLPGATLAVASNAVSSGQLGISLVLPAGVGGAGTELELIHLRFEVSDGAPDDGHVAVGFGDQPLPRRVTSAENLPLETLFAAGSIHLQAAPARLTIARVASTGLEVILRGQPGRTYALEITTDLENWDTMSMPVLGSDGTSTIDMRLDLAISQLFFRMRLVP